MAKRLLYCALVIQKKINLHLVISDVVKEQPVHSEDF